MKRIRLTRGYTAMIDDADYPLVSQHSWCAVKCGGKMQRVYAQANVKIGGVWKRVLMHRVILGAARGQQVDHENNNGLDNRRSNIRIATRGQNQHNCGRRGPRGSSHRSRFKGVSWHRASGKWRAQIAANGRYEYIGLFTDDREAAEAYDARARVLHGAFAKTNF